MKLSVIGIGNMGQALISGFLKSGMLMPTDIHICDMDINKVREYANRTGCIPHTNALEAIQNANYVLLSVKPQVIDSVVASIADSLHEETVVISIAASVTLKRLRRSLPALTPLVRVMPNTPALVGAAVCAICPDGISDDQKKFVFSLFRTCGMIVPCTEKQLDAIGCVSGTGPAYVMLFIESLADAAVKLGIPRDIALEISTMTVYGSGKLAVDTKTHPAVLKDQVCSPGGTTIEGVLALEKYGMRAAVEAAVVAADDKTRLLAGG